ATPPTPFLAPPSRKARKQLAFFNTLSHFDLRRTGGKGVPSQRPQPGVRRRATAGRRPARATPLQRSVCRRPGRHKEWARLRQQALDWLRADLAAYAKLAEKDAKAARQLVRQRLSHWQEDTDLETVRGEKALSKLPGPERQAWQQLWADAA